MTFKFKTAEESPGFLLWQITNEWQRKQRDALSSLKLTHAQFVVLASILWLNMQSDEPITQNMISLHAKMDKMMVSDLIKTLTSKKLITRKPHQTDSRAYALSLTLKGKNCIQQAIPIVEQVDAAFFSKKSDNLVLLNSLLNKLLL